MAHKKGGHRNRQGKQGAPHVWEKCNVNIAPNCKKWSNAYTMKTKNCCNRCRQSMRNQGSLEEFLFNRAM